MATYSITINERTQTGRSILQLMQSLTSVFTVRKINTHAATKAATHEWTAAEEREAFLYTSKINAAKNFAHLL